MTGLGLDRKVKREQKRTKDFVSQVHDKEIIYNGQPQL